MSRISAFPRGRLVAVLTACAAVGLAGCTSASTGPSTGPSTQPSSAPPPVTGTSAPASVAAGVESAIEPVVERGSHITLTAAESQVPYDGTERWAMTYNGHATGPTIRVHPGDHFSITLVNDLQEPTNLHTHGLHVAPSQDNPFIMIEPGQSHTYQYDVPADQQAGTYWYHPHMHGLTAEQVASGLSGAIIVEDSTDAALATATTDRVLVVTDPPLTQANPWGRSGSSSGSSSGHMMGGMMMSGSGSSGVDMMTAMMGRSGPRILTNGQDGVRLQPQAGLLERAHVVNATASTRLLLTYDGPAMIRLSAEGGRLPAPEAVSQVELAPGERTELALAAGAQGGRLVAQRLSNEAGGGPLGVPELVAQVDPRAGGDVSVLPRTLQADTRDLFAPGTPIAQQRVITLDGHMNPTIDGRPFDPDVVNFTARKGTVEEWVIRNNSPMYHPIHLHAWPFQVKGEEGWQDVVTVAPKSEQVIRVAYDDFGGTTVIHCHILDHEDTGMMAVIKVE